MVSIYSTNSSSIWARRIANKSAPCLATSAASWAAAPTSRDEQVELDVRSLLLNLPLHTLSSTTRHNTHEQVFPSAPQSIPQPPMSPVEMHTAQTAVKAALDVLLNEDVPMDAPARPQKFPQLRISTNHASLSAPLSPLSPAMSSLDSPLLSPAESCFSSSSDAEVSAEDDDGAEPKRKGRARMSQEKRKRLARRREREAALLLASQQQQQFYPQQQQQMQLQMQQQFGGFSSSAPVSPVLPHSPFNAVNTTDSFFFAQAGPTRSPVSQVGSLPSFAQSSAQDMMPALSSSPTSSPMSSAASSPLGHMLSPLPPIGSSRSVRSKSPSPPTLVVQPPSPQRLLLKQSQQQYHSFQHQSYQQQSFYSAQSTYRI